MKRSTLISACLLIFILNLTSQVGVGTTAPVAPLDILGSGTGPSIPGSTSTGILRIANSTIEAVDIGKMIGSPFAAWMQAGYNAIAPDPLSLQPVGGNVGIGTTDPTEKLDVNGKIKIGNDASSSVAGTIRWNVETNDFEGFNGTEWLSLTESNNPQWPNENIGAGQITDFLQATSSEGSTLDYFGSSVSISEEYAIVGAPNDNVGGNIGQGSAYIFIKSGNTWTEQAKIVASDGIAYNSFGTSVAISGDYVIIGSPFDNPGGFGDRGSAYIFLRSGTTWSQQAKIVASDGAADDYFGYRVAIDDNYAIIGSPGNNLGANANQGSAYVFLRSGVTWAQQANLVASDGLTDDEFGISVSIKAEYVIVGAYGDQIGSNFNQGSAYIFIRTGSTWTQQAKIFANDGDDGDYFGGAVAIDGTYVVVGAYNDELPPHPAVGSAYIFHRSGTIWTNQAKVQASSVSPSEHFGHTVSISGEMIFIGAYNDESLIGCSDVVRIGLGYIYKKQNNIWTLHSTVTDPLGVNMEQFAYSVSIHGDSFLAGAPSASPNGIQFQGKVVFGKIE